MRLVLLISAWWMVWLAISRFSVTRLDSVSNDTIIATLIFVISFIFGSLLTEKMNITSPSGIHYYRISANFSYCVVIALVIVQLPFIYYMIIDLANGISMQEMRANLFVGQRFSNLEKLILNWTSGILYNYMLVAGVSYQLLYKKNNLIFLLIIYLAVSAVLKGARGEIYQLLMVYVFLILSSPRTEIKKIIKEYKIFAFSVILFSIVFLIGITYQRSGGDVFNQIIDYHAIGFVLFSKYISGENCGINVPTHSVASLFGGIDYIIGIVGRQLSLDTLHNFGKASAECLNNGLIANTFISSVANMEYYSVNGYNSFFTLLVSGYNFAGNLGIALLGVGIGAILGFLRQAIKRNDLIYMHYLIVVLSMLIMGVFASALDSVVFYFILILMNIKAVYLKRRFEATT